MLSLELRPDLMYQQHLTFETNYDLNFKSFCADNCNFNNKCIRVKDNQSTCELCGANQDLEGKGKNAIIDSHLSQNINPEYINTCYATEYQKKEEYEAKMRLKRAMNPNRFVCPEVECKTSSTQEKKLANHIINHHDNTQYAQEAKEALLRIKTENNKENKDTSIEK